MNTSKTSHAINQKIFTQKNLYIALITSLSKRSIASTYS